MSQHNATPHRFTRTRRIPWEVCTSCGLVRLHNPLTDWCVRNGCNHDEHPAYAATVRALGRPASTPTHTVEPYRLPEVKP